MHLKSTKKIALIAILGFVFFGNTAFAEYTAFDFNYGPGREQGVGDYYIVGGSTWIEYSATNTVTRLSAVELPLCKSSAVTGTYTLEVFITSTSSNVIASSTLSLSGIPTCVGGELPETYQRFRLNNYVAWSADNENYTTVWFHIKDNTGGGTIYRAQAGTLGPAYDNITAWNSTQTSSAYCPYPTGDCTVAIRGIADGTMPENQNQGVYSSSTTGIICVDFDIGCYFAKGLSWAFYPTATVYLFNSTPTLASTTPFAYIFESIEIWDTVFSGYATGTQTLTIDFAPMGIATSSLIAGTLGSTVQGKNFFTTIRNWIEVFLWFIFAMGILRIALGLIGWTHSFDGGSNTATRVANITKGTYNRFKL
jgi:hypothetical protein